MAGRHLGRVGLLVGAIPERDLDTMVEEATVDAYGEDEELAGFHAVLTDRLALPFNTRVLGVDVVVEDLDLRPGTGVVALCRHGAHRQAIGLLDLPLPDPPPQGFEWIEAFRRWAP
jgi:hypothetical protein